MNRRFPPALRIEVNAANPFWEAILRTPARMLSDMRHDACRTLQIERAALIAVRSLRPGVAVLSFGPASEGHEEPALPNLVAELRENEAACAA